MILLKAAHNTARIQAPQVLSEIVFRNGENMVIIYIQYLLIQVNGKSQHNNTVTFSDNVFLFQSCSTISNFFVIAALFTTFQNTSIHPFS